MAVSRFGAAFATLGAVIPAAASAQASEASKPLLPGVTVAVRNTFDVATALAGENPGSVTLDKLQISATLRGERIGMPGWQVHAQLFRLSGKSLSTRLGDIQTADNIEAPHALRLFEAYLAKNFGAANRGVAVRIGMIDLNSQFDSIDPAALMISSSQGIGPDLSKSGRNGPSIFPFSALGATVTAPFSSRLVLRAGVFDGTAGNPDRPHSFFPARLNPGDGILGITQIDWLATKESRVEAGIWGYTASQAVTADVRARGRGAYVSYEAPVSSLPHTDFWVRLGIANRRAQPISAYVGSGVAMSGLFAGRKDDRIGFSVGHAIVAGAYASSLDVHRAETSLEATYQAKLSRRFVLQPDLDFIHHPAGAPRAKDALSLIIRIAYAFAVPGRMQASDPGDPTVPPDGAPSLGGGGNF